MAKKPLTPKQEAFAFAYTDCLDVDKAALASGYEFANGSLGYYVYFLVDPETRAVFYVGKGKGDRISSHVKAAKSNRIANGKKHDRIAEILNSGKQVREIVFADGMCEGEALAVERAFITLLREFGLVNISNGNVTSLESAASKANALLGQMIPFGVWLATAGERRLKTAKNLYGSHLACYNAIADEFRQVIGYGRT